MKNEKNVSLVVQSNSMVEAQYKLPVTSQKIIRKIISMILPTDTEFEKRYYRLTVQDISELLKDDIRPGGSFYANVKQAVTALRTTSVNIPKMDMDNGKSWLASTWLASAEYNHKGGYYEFEFSSKLETELLKLKKYFTQYHFENISRLSSQYSIRIYELLAQIRNQITKERIILLSDLRVILGITSKQYTRFNDFKRFVLNIAKEELPQKSDIRFKYDPIKTGRKVTAIKYPVLAEILWK